MMLSRMLFILEAITTETSDIIDDSFNNPTTIQKTYLKSRSNVLRTPNVNFVKQFAGKTDDVIF